MSLVTHSLTLICSDYVVTHSLHQILLVVSKSEHLIFLRFWHGPRMQWLLCDSLTLITLWGCFTLDKWNWAVMSMAVKLATVTTGVAISRPPSSASKTGGKNRSQESNSTSSLSDINLVFEARQTASQLRYTGSACLLHFSSLLSPSTASVVTGVHWSSTISSPLFFIMLWLWKRAELPVLDVMLR